MRIVHVQVYYRMRWNIGGTLIWQIAKILCFADFNIGGGRPRRWFEYIGLHMSEIIWRINIGGPYQNRQSTKLKLC